MRVSTCLPIYLRTRFKMESTSESNCGPLKVRLSEHEACYDGKSGAEVPCPDKSQTGAQILKRCRPPYAMKDEVILNVTYHCGAMDWLPRYGACQTGCGRSTANNKYPWMAAIYENDELKCTGTIISAYHVLTALACFPEYVGHVGPMYGNFQLITNTSNLTIVAGKHYTNIHRKKKSAQIRKVKAVINRPSVVHFTRKNLILLEVDNDFDFFEDVQPVCIDWANFYQRRDFSEGNEAVAVDWEYNKDEVVPCENSNELNVQYWHASTCRENVGNEVWDESLSIEFCGTYLNSNRTNCGKSMGAGLFFKSSPWLYYLRGITIQIATEPKVTHIFYTTVSSHLNWLLEQVGSHRFLSKLESFFLTKYDNLSDRKAGCILPEHIKYGQFKLTFGQAYRPGAWVSTGTRILPVCTVNSVETPSSTRCNLGEWQPPIEMLKCRRPGTCPTHLSSPSEDIFCRLNGEEVSCVEPAYNSTAVIRCKPFHAILGSKPIYKCQNGVWDQSFARCTLECGTKRVDVSTLIIGGSEVIRNEYPWVVAVYRSTDQICGGTIISRSYVLSAAHCFTTSKGMVQNKELYTIIAGKHYRDITAEEPSSQSRKIKFLHIHDDYKGSLQKYRDDIALIELDTELTPTLEVQPACLDWDNLYEGYDFIDGNKAVVAGWGYTQQGGFPSDVLKKLVLPYRTKDVCIANLPDEFSFQYVATDKICAGEKDNNMNVCEGDSGGGLYFQSDNKRFYIRGIVSLTSKTRAGTCHLSNFALYTKVSKYLPWIEEITRRVL